MPHVEALEAPATTAVPARRGWLPLACAFAVAGYLFLAGLGTPALIDPDEGRNAEVAREMRETGRWIVPQYNGFAYLDKPAFFFRLVALSFSAFGETEFAARVPSALFGLATLALLAAFCRRVYGPREAALAVLVAATAPLVIAFARLVIFDMVLAFFVTAALCAGYLAEEGTRRRLWHLGGSGAAACATLVKGPVGFVVPMVVLAIFHLVERRPKAIVRLLHPLNLLVFAAITVPWFLAVARERPDFPHYGLVWESLKRFATGESDRSKPFWYYLPIIAVGLGAWTILVPRAAVRAWRARAALSRPTRFLMIWALGTLVFFSLSGSKLPQYVLTTVLALSALVARVLADGRGAEGIRKGLAWIGVLGLGTAATLTALAVWREPVSRALGSGSFDRAEPVVLPAAAALAVAGGIALAARRTASVRLHVAAFVAAPVLLGTVSWSGLVAFAENASSRAIARAVEAAAPEAPYACLACYPRGVPFYLRRYPTVFTEDGRELRSNYLRYGIAKGDPWPRSIVPYARRDEWLAAAPRPLLLLAQEARLGDLRAAARGADVREIAPGWYGALVGGP